MWNDRQLRDRRIGAPEIFWSWAIIVLIVVALAGWAGVDTLAPESVTPVAKSAGR